MPSPRPPPTADQIAQIIIAAARETGAHPLQVPRQAEKPHEYQARPIVRARIYAAIAIRKRFDLPMPLIGRMLGEPHPPYVSIVYAKATKGQFDWFEAEALQRVMAAPATSLPAPPQNAQAEPAAAAISLPEREVGPPPRAPVPSSDFGAVPIPLEKKSLRDQLRQAVENTAKMPSQN